jgi:hypothetical protein
MIETHRNEGGPVFANWQTLESMDILPISTLLHLTNPPKTRAKLMKSVNT